MDWAEFEPELAATDQLIYDIWDIQDCSAPLKVSSKLRSSLCLHIPCFKCKMLPILNYLCRVLFWLGYLFNRRQFVPARFKVPVVCWVSPQFNSRILNLKIKRTRVRMNKQAKSALFQENEIRSNPTFINFDCFILYYSILCSAWFNNYRERSFPGSATALDRLGWTWS